MEPGANRPTAGHRRPPMRSTTRHPTIAPVLDLQDPGTTLLAPRTSRRRRAGHGVGHILADWLLRCGQCLADLWTVARRGERRRPGRNGAPAHREPDARGRRDTVPCP